MSFSLSLVKQIYTAQKAVPASVDQYCQETGADPEAVWAFIVKLTGHSVDGWSSTLCSIWLIGGVQLLALGIIGEYIGKIYAEVKHRPRYIIADYLNTAAPSEKDES